MFVFSTKQATESGTSEANMAQFNELTFARNSSAQAVADFIARARVRGEAANAPILDAVNAVDDIRRLYKAYDQTVLKQFRPNTEFTLLNDLMPLSRSVRWKRVCVRIRSHRRPWLGTRPCQVRLVLRWMRSLTPSMAPWCRSMTAALNSTGVTRYSIKARHSHPLADAQGGLCR